jgi:crotonobetainyl-CoA:carnitine CoA-transferase CaiB-like acyl-CoA transferase
VLCEALGMTELQEDRRFNSVEARGRHAEELVAILDSKFSSKTRNEWIKILKEAGCIFTPVQGPMEVTRDDQAMSNNYFVEVGHPEWGKLKVAGFPWDFSETPASWRRRAPHLGEHTDEILSELGYQGEDIRRLKQEGVILSRGTSMK